MTLTLRPMPYLPDRYRLTITTNRRNPPLPSAGWAAFELGPRPNGGGDIWLLYQPSQARPIVIHDESPSIRDILTTQNCRQLATLAGRTVYLAPHEAEIPIAPTAATDQAAVTRPVLRRSWRVPSPGAGRAVRAQSATPTSRRNPSGPSLRSAPGFPPGVAHTCVQRALPGEAVLTQQPPGPQTGTRKEKPQ
jgi:hypothetical protein